MLKKIKLRYGKLIRLANSSSSVIKEFGFILFLKTAYSELKKNKLAVFQPVLVNANSPTISEDVAYLHWIDNHIIKHEIESVMNMELQKFSYKPKFNIILTENENKLFTDESLNSIRGQIYNNFELSSTRGNSDFTIFLKSGDILASDALFRIVELLNKNREANIIYSDEDLITDDKKRTQPFFKPDWSDDLFLGMDYISNFCAIRTSLLDSFKINDQYGSAKIYDLLLRLVENTDKIFHLPNILISTRLHDEKFKTNFEHNALKAISEALRRRNIKAQVGFNNRVGNFSSFRVEYFLESKPRVSIIIPTKDNKFLLKRCLDAIRKNTTYNNYEIIIIDNNSTKEETVSYLKSLPHQVIRYEQPFNFSKMNNLGVSKSSGEYILFLNDDTAPLRSNWLSELISICMQKGVGIVGSKLVHNNNTIQHAGIAILKTGAGFHPLQNVNSNSPGYFGFINMIRNCSAVTGACLLIRKKIFDEIGGFDDDFDLYYGDTDLCLNVINHGYRVVYTPYAVLLHQGSSTIKENSSAYFAVENHQHFIKKWPHLKNGDPFYNPNLELDYKIDLN